MPRLLLMRYRPQRSLHLSSRPLHVAVPHKHANTRVQYTRALPRLPVPRRYLLFGSDKSSMQRQFLDFFSEQDWQANERLQVGGVWGCAGGV